MLIGIDWPHEVYFNTSEDTMLSFNGQAARLLDTELRVASHQTHGPVEFEIVASTWAAAHPSPDTTCSAPHPSSWYTDGARSCLV